jgi:protein SCO1/2
MDAGNWWFLRPENPDRAEEVVTDTFGVNFQFVPAEEREMDNMAWIHGNLILLANADGYVERAYDRQPPNPADVLEDTRTLRERW